MSLPMTGYDLTEEQVELAGLVRSFADEVVAPVSYEADRTKTLPMDVVAQMGDMGLFGLPFPEEVGGQGGDYVTLGLAIEALARVDQSIAITLEAGRRRPARRHDTESVVRPPAGGRGRSGPVPHRCGRRVA